MEDHGRVGVTESENVQSRNNDLNVIVQLIKHKSYRCHIIDFMCNKGLVLIDLVYKYARLQFAEPCVIISAVATRRNQVHTFQKITGEKFNNQNRKLFEMGTDREKIDAFHGRCPDANIVVTFTIYPEEDVGEVEIKQKNKNMVKTEYEIDIFDFLFNQFLTGGHKFNH